MGMTNVLNMLCGLALFLYGMHVMGEGLTRASGGKLEGILEKLTKSKLKAVLLGAAVTAVNLVLLQAVQDVWDGLTVLLPNTDAVFRELQMLLSQFLMFLDIWMKFRSAQDMRLMEK